MFTDKDKSNLNDALNKFIGIINQFKMMVANYQPPVPPPIDSKPEYLTRKATAEYLNISLSTLWRLTKEGKLKSYAVGKKVMYKTNEVQNFITKNEKKWTA